MSVSFAIGPTMMRVAVYVRPLSPAIVYGNRSWAVVGVAVKVGRGAVACG